MSDTTITNLPNSASESEMTSGSYIAMDVGSSETKKLPAQLVAKKSEGNSKIHDQANQYAGYLALDDGITFGKFPIANLFESIAPIFDSTVDYTSGQGVMYQGKLYIFKTDHPAGSWSGSDAVQVDVDHHYASKVSVENDVGLDYKYAKTNNELSSITEHTAASRIIRANKFTGKFVGIEFYATAANVIVEYGLLKSDGHFQKMGIVHSKLGPNKVLFDAPVACSPSTQEIYVWSYNVDCICGTDDGGIGMLQWDNGNPLRDYPTWELAYYGILEKPIGDYIFPKFDKESVCVKTNTDIESISAYSNGAVYKRANALEGTFVGILVYANNSGNLEVGTMANDGTCTKLLDYNVSVGYNFILFDNPIQCSPASQEIYVYDTMNVSILSANDSGGVGMWQFYNNEYRTFPNWELAYYGIEILGADYVKYKFNELDSAVGGLVSLDKLKYGEIVLPSRIEVANNRECNLWWSSIANIVEGDKSVYFETVCTIGHNMERGFRIKQYEAAPGQSYSLRIVSRDAETRQIISDVTTVIKGINQNVGSGSKNILMMGDSRTLQSFGGTNGTNSFANFVKANNETITTEVKTLCDAHQGATFTFIGDSVSALSPTVRNCSQSGATVTYPSGKFTTAGGVVAYCEANGLSAGANLDYATIMYGINDLSDWNENRIDQYSFSIAKIPTIIANTKTLVNTILAAYPNCKILIVIEPSTCAGQDGWALWQGMQTYRHSMEEIEKALKYYRKELIAAFDNSAYSANVTICSAGLWCDRLYGFPYLVESTSMRSSVKTVDVFQECVHPFDDGYKSIADGIFSSIKYLENS